MGLTDIALVVLAALAGGFVSGLTGFGTGITAMGLWPYALPPPVVASLVVVCSVISQAQTLPMIWRTIEWRRIMPYVILGLFGVPIGTWLLTHTDPRSFEISIGLFLVLYSEYVLMKRTSADAPGVAQRQTGLSASLGESSVGYPVCPARPRSYRPIFAAIPSSTAETCCRPSTWRSRPSRWCRTRFPGYSPDKWDGSPSSRSPARSAAPGPVSGSTAVWATATIIGSS
jgi:hypothetical protein